MSTRLFALVSLFASVTGFVDRAHAQAGDFVPGDFCLISPVVQGLSPTSGAIMRIDPATGAASMLVDLDLTLGRPQTMAYDAYRNRMIFTGGPVGASANFATWLVDGNGALQALGFDGRLIHAFAPTGDGRIYYHDESDVTAWIGWIDAANQPHQLPDAAGAAPLLLNGLPWPNPNAMLCHAPTNSQIVAEFNTAQFSCTGANTVDLSVRRIP